MGDIHLPWGGLLQAAVTRAPVAADTVGGAHGAADENTAGAQAQAREHHAAEGSTPSGDSGAGSSSGEARRRSRDRLRKNSRDGVQATSAAPSPSAVVSQPAARQQNILELARFYAKHDPSKLQPPKAGGGAGSSNLISKPLGQLHHILDACPDTTVLSQMLQQKYGSAPQLSPEMHASASADMPAARAGHKSMSNPVKPRKQRKGRQET